MGHRILYTGRVPREGPVVKKKKAAKPRKLRWHRLSPLVTWALIAAVAGAAAFLVVYAATSGGGSGSAKTDFSAQIAKTPSDASAGQPFQGGPRLYFPVESMDLGQVPFNTMVSESFDLKNVGDSTLKIEDVQVKMLEGC
jgi:hypothetical protein